MLIMMIIITNENYKVILKIITNIMKANVIKTKNCKSISLHDHGILTQYDK